MRWAMGFWEHGGDDASEMWEQFHASVVQRFEQYQLPVIELGKETPRQAVCQVFEKVNTGGVTLTVFELLTATFAADEFDLRRDWDNQRESWSDPKYGSVLRCPTLTFCKQSHCCPLSTGGNRIWPLAGTITPLVGSAADVSTCST